MTQYRCKHCGKVIQRDSNKAWITSYCLSQGKLVRIVKLKKMKNIHYGKSTAKSSVVSKTRRCSECKRVFASAESFRAHKYRGGGCRTLEALYAAGYTETPTGWKHSK